jgi:hypothetical protein
VNILGGAVDLEARRAVALGPLAPLADSLAGDLEPLVAREPLFVPHEKARLTRVGGRCATDGVLLDFDPWSPHRHRCPRCGVEYEGDEHYRWWVMGYQLWLAERALHAAILFALRGDERHRDLATRIIDAYCDRYLEYPNRDNVLGPTRPFFSTYLESIWLLQLTLAMDALEGAAGTAPLGGRFRERIVEPSAALIASYDEGLSNRQVWNNAALAAAGCLLGREVMLLGAFEGSSGLVTHLRDALFADGTWYEGENYHLFAHRGLWYGMMLARRVDRTPDEALVARYRSGFETPFFTALPDFTFPSRRDSQYRVSLRQWRIAESAELGSAELPQSSTLAGALAELYRDDVHEGDTSRWKSTAEAERNVPGVRLDRASLGWKSLLFARETLREPATRITRSVLLPDQGLAVFRRQSGRIYAALDYGHSGAGHGHPDRLNLWLVDGDARILEDVGTGSYVDRSLHWYRSTLAHNAPLVDGQSQSRVHGTLMAFGDGDPGWVRATANIAPGVRATRTLLVLDDYLIEETRWQANREVTIDLPIHVDANVHDVAAWEREDLTGGTGLEDGFTFLDDSARAARDGSTALHAVVGDVDVRGWCHVAGPHELWRTVAPGPPGERERPFLLVRARGAAGAIRTVWTWSPWLAKAILRSDGITITAQSGEEHDHVPMDNGWRLTRTIGEHATTIELGADCLPAADAQESTESPVPSSDDRLVRLRELREMPESIGTLTTFSDTTAVHRARLGESHYRRSDHTWREAGRPEALVAIAVSAETLGIEVSVRKTPPAFAERRSDNPLDNEHPDVNSDGVQLHLRASGTADPVDHMWLLVPEDPEPGVRLTARTPAAQAIDMRATWRATPQGWQMRIEVPRQSSLAGPDLALDVLVNETTPERERRRGQLVLSGARGEWVYLRGDRQDPSRYVPLHIAHD